MALSDCNRSAAALAVVLEGNGETLGFGPYLPRKIGDLRPQFLDPRMLVQQRGRLFGELRPQRHLLLGQPAQNLGIHDIGDFRRRTTLQGFADDPRLRPRHRISARVPRRPAH